MSAEAATKGGQLAGLAVDLEAAWGGARDVVLRPIPESHSGFTYWVSATVDGVSAEAVLRLPPPGARPVGPADVVRQTRIMRALGASKVPVPEILASSPEPVLGGRPFVLMSKVPGVGLADLGDQMTAHQIMRASFDTLELIADVPAGETGLDGEAVTDPLEDVRRWAALRERAPAELVARAPELEARLLRARPATGRPRLVHGDYHPGNLVFRDGSVVAVLDWEIAGLGVVPSDKAGLCLLAIRKRFGEAYSGEPAAIPLEDTLAMAGEPDFDHVLAATCHKYAAILGYNLGLHRRGKRIDPVYEGLTRTIPGLIDVGLELVA